MYSIAFEVLVNNLVRRTANTAEEAGSELVAVACEHLNSILFPTIVGNKQIPHVGKMLNAILEIRVSVLVQPVLCLKVVEVQVTAKAVIYIINGALCCQVHIF